MKHALIHFSSSCVVDFLVVCGVVCVLLCECLPVLDMCYALFIDDCGVFVCLGMNSVLCVLGGYFWCFGDY